MLLARIDKMDIKPRFKRLLSNLSRLSFHVAAIILSGIGYIILSLMIAGFDSWLIQAFQKLLMAWICIRLASQIINNSFVRQSVALLAWTVAALSILGILDQTTRTMDTVGLNLGEIRISVLTVFKSAIALGILLAVAIFTIRLSEKRISQATSLTPSARVLLTKVIKILLIGLAIMIALMASGLDLSALAVFGGALGLGIGFGLQKVISNLFSGFLLLLDKSIKPGDIIELEGGAFGWVDQLSARYVSVVTRDNKEYLIPNEDFVTQQVINWSYTNRLIRVETKFGVHYDSDPHLIRKLGVEAASKPERVVADPAPVCHLVEFGDSSLNFVLRYWITDAEQGITNTKGQVMLALWDILKENNVQIPYPHREVFIHEKKGA